MFMVVFSMKCELSREILEGITSGSENSLLFSLKVRLCYNGFIFIVLSFRSNICMITY